MFRSVVAALGLVTILVTLIIVGTLTVNSLGTFLGGGLSNGTPSGGDTSPVVLRISGTSGVHFSGNYTTSNGSQNISGTLGMTPTDYKVGGEDVTGVNVVTVNVQKQGTYGTLKVEILKNGQVVQSAESNATNNSVSLTFSL